MPPGIHRHWQGTRHKGNAMQASWALQMPAQPELLQVATQDTPEGQTKEPCRRFPQHQPLTGVLLAPGASTAPRGALMGSRRPGGAPNDGCARPRPVCLRAAPALAAVAASRGRGHVRNL